ncbi:hypothetical protein ASG95_00650 [Phycicoccus sp. Soil803]|nr:hypothetical protein ASG95_00650 [Phycicoccus sp. Soil803]
MTLVASICGVSLFLAAGQAAGVAGAEHGKVTRIVDGDTVEVDVWGDGTPTPVTVRNAGIQTMELGECHAAAATSVMSSRTLGKVVNLSSKDAASRSQGRWVRFVDVPVSGQPSVDPQLASLQQGQALWLVIPPEDGRAAQYHLAMEQAAAKKIGLWDDDACGSGPAQDAKIDLSVNYDGDGDDAANPNTEYIRLRNTGTSTVALGGWVLRSGGPDRYTIRSGTTLAPGASFVLHVGKGTNSNSVQYWGGSAPRFQNLNLPGTVGGGAYLFDPDGDIRAHASYPCVLSCTDPTIGKVTIRANYDAPGDDMTNPNGEYVLITSTSATPVDLSWYVIQVGESTRELGPGTVLKTKGSTLKLYVGKGTSGYTTKYWGKSSAIMPNTGGTAVLRTTETIRIVCTAWGTGRC